MLYNLAVNTLLLSILLVH